MKVYVIAPKNPESFWAFDCVLPSLGKRCAFPNLALPTRRLDAMIRELRETELAR